MNNSWFGRLFNFWVFSAAFGFLLLTACHFTEQVDGRNSSATKKPFKAAETVPLSVETVETFGFWSDAKVQGSYRLVLLQEGYEHLSHRLIIEWIELSQKSGRALIEQIEPDLGKATGLTGYAIAVTKIESSELGGATVHFDLVHPITIALQSVALKLGEPGVYEIFLDASAAESE